MPLVFVHGVNTRRGETAPEQKIFDNRVEFFKQQFREVAFPGTPKLDVRAPYWGHLGAQFARDLKCIPHDAGHGFETLGLDSLESAPLEEITAAFLDGELGLDQEVQDNPILTLARRRGMPAAIDLLFAGASAAPVNVNMIEEPHKMPEAARLAKAALEYAAANPDPAWLGTVADDRAFIDQLLEETKGAMEADPKFETLGIGNTLGGWLKGAAAGIKKAATKVAGIATGAVIGGFGGVVVGAAAGGGTKSSRQAFMLASRYIRPAASTFIARFFGDVFKYMQNRQPVIDEILKDIDAAAQARDAAIAERKKQEEAGQRIGELDDKLILVGHSFGGILLFDTLTHFRPNLECDLLVTVGSQVALFAEISLFANQAPLNAAFQAKTAAPRPKNIKRWINVFDLTDYVGFGVNEVFTGAKDFAFEADAYPIISHGAYFDTPSLYVRLNKRAGEAFAKGTD